ncbi:Protein UXT-like [Gracilariopsis chorda]|uniref:Protein UXT-like n=1 Tax=Gracilariopsis chorda TaxID=448386 RepID=A0A2V3IIX1_9FLOR|nr:Protein UXT-like [Gracilariopsis chorda]|eukprot:PXF42009.1 Protein UXT-like [Gracilariopsis chorda]
MKKPASADSTAEEDHQTSATREEADAAIDKYSRDLEKRLYPALETTFSLRDKALAQLAELEQTERGLRLVERECCSSRGGKSGKPAVETRVNLGENFFVRAEAQRTATVVLDLGLGVLAEVTFSEANKFVQERRQMLRRIADSNTKKATKMQAMVEGVMKCISGLRVQTLAQQKNASLDDAD